MKKYNDESLNRLNAAGYNVYTLGKKFVLIRKYSKNCSRLIARFPLYLPRVRKASDENENGF